MQHETKRYAAIVAAVATVLMVLVFKWFSGTGESPAAAIPDQLETLGYRETTTELRHQPTIIRAEADVAVPRMRNDSGVVAPPQFDRFAGDRNSDPRQSADVEFLPIPSLDPTLRP